MAHYADQSTPSVDTEDLSDSLYDLLIKDEEIKKEAEEYLVSDKVAQDVIPHMKKIDLVWETIRDFSEKNLYLKLMPMKTEMESLNVSFKKHLRAVCETYSTTKSEIKALKRVVMCMEEKVNSLKPAYSQMEEEFQERDKERQLLRFSLSKIIDNICTTENVARNKALTQTVLFRTENALLKTKISTIEAKQAELAEEMKSSECEKLDENVDSIEEDEEDTPPENTDEDSSVVETDTQQLHNLTTDEEFSPLPNELSDRVEIISTTPVTEEHYEPECKRQAISICVPRNVNPIF